MVYEQNIDKISDKQWFALAVSEPWTSIVCEMWWAYNQGNTVAIKYVTTFHRTCISGMHCSPRYAIIPVNTLKASLVPNWRGGRRGLIQWSLIQWTPDSRYQMSWSGKWKKSGGNWIEVSEKQKNNSATVGTCLVPPISFGEKTWEYTSSPSGMIPAKSKRRRHLSYKLQDSRKSKVEDAGSRKSKVESRS